MNFSYIKDMKLYIDKNCNICRNFGNRIIEKNKNIEIRDFNEKGNCIIFEDESGRHIEFQAISKAMYHAGKESIFLNLITALPIKIQKFLYHILSKNRKFLSIFCSRNQTKI
jgi:hypothetical protein|tara:strand:- start:76 stop:411 length:336 start_codon:yes stop_codon:yes gene_type:complete